MFSRLIFGALIITEIILQLKIGYPPTAQQLEVGVHDPNTLWGLRLLSLAILLSATYLLSNVIPQKYKKYYWIFVLASPTISHIWMSYPIDSLKILLMSIVVFLGSKANKRFIYSTLVSILVVILLNLVVFKQDPAIINALSISSSQEEVTKRFTIEDNLNPNIELPLIFRRIGYNKYFVTLKKTADESVSYFDLETLFFQEVHPLNQKGTILFFWPQIFIFFLSIWILRTNPEILKNKKFALIFTTAFFYYITTNTTSERRLIMSLWPIATIMSIVLTEILDSPKKWLRYTLIFMVLLTTYGWATNLYDRYKRPDYWFDNRPLAYSFIFNSLKNKNLDEYDEVIVPDTLHRANEYCDYYIDECSKIKFDNFDLSEQKIKQDSLYIGFIGNFIGPRADNNFVPEHLDLLKEQNLKVLDQTHLRDNIANTYGHFLLISKPIKQ